jgi:HEAT repeat protein
MARVRRFGPLFYGTMAVACLVLLGTYGTLELRPHVRAALRFRAINRQWHDSSLPLAARRKAAEQLADFGSDAVPAYLSAVDDPNGQVRMTAYAHLASLRPVSSEAIAACIAAVAKDPDPRARAAAAEALASAASTVEAGPGGHRQAIVEALVAAGHDASPIVRLAMLRAMAAGQVMMIDPGPWLEDSDRSVRLAAAWAVLSLDPANQKRIVPSMRAMITGADPAYPVDMGEPLALLYRVDPQACTEFVPVVISLLRSQDRETRRAAIHWLGNLGAEARSAIPMLEALMDRGDGGERSHVARVLLLIDPALRDRVVAYLFATLRDGKIPAEERSWAFIPLRMLLNDPHVPARIRAEILRQLRAMQDEPEVPSAVDAGVRQLLREHDKGSPSEGETKPHSGSAGASVQPTSRFQSRAASLRCCSSRARSTPR